MGALLINVAVLLVMPFWLTGIITRVKSLWSGRKGAPVFQLAYDVHRLVRKTPVYSSTTTPLFRMAPHVFLLTALGSALIVPLLGSSTIVSFRFDFVWFAYVWALGRVAVMLAALDTGSSFEGMGAAREATFSTILEPVIFLATGALALTSHTQEMRQILVPALRGGAAVAVWATALVALFIALQVETARMPIDDPATHLELTMVHEVMILDHCGPDLAAIQYGAAVKLLTGCSMIATLMNPWAGTCTALSATANLALATSIAAAIGTVESLIARLKLKAVPAYIAVALLMGLIAVVVAGCLLGGTP